MAFTPGTKKKIVQKNKAYESPTCPCTICGACHLRADAAHIIDGEEWKNSKNNDSQTNGIPLCPNCHRVFDEVLRPRLYEALKEWGAQNLPESWAKNNKYSQRKDSRSLCG